MIDSLELKLELQDNEWEFEFVDHDRQIVRAIVFDELDYFYFVRVVRNDDFGKAILIETAGGGVESEEELTKAIRRELKEELGAEIDIICKIVSFGQKKLTQDEIECFHLSTLKMTFEEAVQEYETCSSTKLGRLIANRELPILKRAKEIIDTIVNS